ncbi:hypothetical protein V7O66_05545 [Methanolobus sp. ZRKC3]|uniref:hypothetical protein n=1 Tax=Methanolobus sp. ZRKC3 TaxID=3125786 RepID=UPI003244518A
MSLWEYDVKPVHFGVWETTKNDLNELGVDGWELIKFTDDVDEDGMVQAFFKREVDGLEY